MLERVLINVQNALAATGAKGAAPLAAQFRTMDLDGDGALTAVEFAAGLRGAGVKVHANDIAALFRATDANGDGRLVFNEFVEALCGHLSPHRRGVIEGVWRRVAGDDETVALETLLSAYRPSKHPSVEKGAKTPQQVHAALEELIAPYVTKGRITFPQFAACFNVAHSFESDYDFDATMESVWGRATPMTNNGGAAAAFGVLRKALGKRGVRGVVSLARNFRLADTDASGTLREGEFVRSLQLSQCDLSPAQVAALFHSFDGNRDGVISHAEFLTKLKGPMNARRVQLVDKAFDVLDTNGDGIVEPREVVAKYDAASHPLRGDKSEQDVLREFLDTFDVGGVVDGKVTREEFRNYYHSVSSGIEKDELFELVVRNAWRLKGGEGQCANSTNLRVLVTHSNGTSTVECLEDDLDLQMPRDAVEILDRLQGQGLDAISVANHGTTVAKPAVVVRAAVKTVANDDALATLREALKRRGVRGITTLARAFRVADTDRSGVLSREELERCLGRADVVCEDLEQVFATFDRDHSGGVAYDEFLRTLRGPMNARRVHLVDRAFDILDVDKNGVLEPADVVQKYDAKNHPQVRRNEKTEVEVLREFLDTFDVGGVVDGKVTKEEFANYYANVSSSIDDDDYFELCLRNAWHISGGEGWCANTANLRVLVTHSDGSQTVEGLEDDLGLQMPRDAGEIMRRLRAQGLDVVAVEGSGGERVEEPSLDVATDDVLPACVEAIRGRGTRGFVVLKRRLRARSNDGVSRDGFVTSSRDAGVPRGVASDAQLRGVFAELQSSGRASLRACLNALHVPLPSQRRALAQAAFSSLDGDNLNRVAPQTIVAAFDATHHPEVVSGRQTAEAARDDVLAAFEYSTTLEDFLDYHAAISACVDEDAAFADFVRNAWRVQAVVSNRAAGHSSPQRGRKIISGGDATGGYALPGKSTPLRRRNRSPRPVCVSQGATTVVAKLRANVLKGGARGVARLDRALRDAASSQSRDLTFEELARACRDKTGLASTELRLLFDACDKGGEGTCDYVAFASLVAPALTGAKLLAVRAAWARCFGEVEQVPPERVAAAFAAARHPEVVAGRQTEAQQFSEFLDTFDVPGTSATLQDFLAYHRGVAASAPNADYWDAVIQDAWRAPGVVAATAPAPLASFERTTASPVRAAGVPFHRKETVTFGDEDRDLPVKPRPRKLAPEVDPGVARLLFDLRTQLAAHGARGIVGLGRKFRICDDDGDGRLSVAEFNKALNELGLAELTAQERRAVFSHFDCDSSGFLNYEEFLMNVRGPLSQARLGIIDEAFAVLDVNKDGAIAPDEIASKFDASRHPDVLRGKATEQDVYRDFLDTFDVGGVKDALVTLQEFRNYYHAVSCSIDDDAYFIQMVRNAWHLGTESTTALRVLVRKSDGTSSIECVEDDLGLQMPRDADVILRKLRAQGIDAVAVEGPGGASQAKLADADTPKTFRDVRKHQAAGGGARQKSFGRRVGGYSTNAFDSNVSLGHAPLPPPPHAPRSAAPYVVDAPPPPPRDVGGVLAKARSKLRFLGCRGVAGIARKLRGADASSFARVVGDALSVSVQDAEALARAFATGNGVDVDSFMERLRGEVSARRRGLIDAAFDALDDEREGSVAVAAVVDAYEAARHPEVLAGARTTEAALRDFLDTFEVGGDVSGRASRREFHEYYANVSAAVEDDAAFETLVRNAWGLQEAPGRAAVHALVTHRDGRQSVEVLSDSGEDALDALRARGVDAIDVKLQGAATKNTRTFRSTLVLE